MSGGSTRGARPTQSWDPESYARNARFVSDLGIPVLELLAPRPGERILDLGCGDGALTERLVEAGASVVGIDSSVAQVEAARARGLDARVIDGEALPFEGEFDAVFSNAALHWMRCPDRVIAGVRSALRSGGRFVGELGGHGCVSRIRRALYDALAKWGIDGRELDPWFFPTDDAYAARLERFGFEVRFIRLFERPTPLPGDLGDWLETFAESFLRAPPEEERAALIDEVREALRPELCTPDGSWCADYVRLRFAARRAPSHASPRPRDPTR